MPDDLLATHQSLSDLSADDRRSGRQANAPRGQPYAGSQTTCLRQTPRQATSAVAHVAPPPDDDDPLLAFAPYLHAAPRRNSITPDLQRRFVATLAATGIVKQAAKSIGRSLEAIYKLRHRPGAEGFAGAWDAALERGVQRLEDCAMERAMHGTRTPIVSGGEILGWWDKPDNSLLRFLMQYRLPQKYGVQQLKPGNALYDAMRAQWEEELAEQRRRELPQARALIEQKLMELRDRVLARREPGAGDPPCEPGGFSGGGGI